MVDASYCQESGAAGYGYWIASERGKKGGGGPMRGAVCGSAAAEMLAACNALFVALELTLAQPGDHVLLQTDCVSAIQAFEGSRTVRVKDEFTALVYFRKLKKDKSINVSFRHVKGHTTRSEPRYVTNKLCDRRAKEGMRQARATLSAQVD